MQDHRRREFGDRREEGATHEWPIWVEEARVCARHIRSEEEQGVDRARGNDRSYNAPARAADAAEGLGVATPGKHPDLEPDEGHRRGEMRGHRCSRVRFENGLASEPGLEEDKCEKGDRGPLQRSAALQVSQRERDHCQNDQPDHRRDGAMDPLQPRLVGNDVA